MLRRAAHVGRDTIGHIAALGKTGVVFALVRRAIGKPTVRALQSTLVRAGGFSDRHAILERRLATELRGAIRVARATGFAARDAADERLASGRRGKLAPSVAVAMAARLSETGGAVGRAT